VEWMNHRLKYCKITFDELKEKHIVYTTPPMRYRKYLEDGFKTPTGKVELFSQKYQSMGYSPVPEYREMDARYLARPETFEQYPLIGTTRRSGFYTHTQLRNVPRLLRFEPEALIRINPNDAAKRGILNNEITSVKTIEGLIKVKARITDETAQGVVIIDFGWGNPWDGGANVNILTNADERDPVSCSTSNHRFRCQVTKG
jgi:anaerobic selenocysteine-containing dehydrogenase